MTQSKNSTYATVFCDGRCRRFKIGKFSIISWGECPGHQFSLLCRDEEKPLLVFGSPEEGWPTEAIPKCVVVHHSEGSMAWTTVVQSDEAYVRLDGCCLVVTDEYAWWTTGPLEITFMDESGEESW